jgi:hypothetical protein
MCPEYAWSIAEPCWLMLVATDQYRTGTGLVRYCHPTGRRSVRTRPHGAELQAIFGLSRFACRL